MPETQHTKIVYSLQAVVVMSLMFMMISAAIFGGIVYVHNKQTAAHTKPLGNAGASMEAIEKEYGKVNKEALLETKEGLFARIRAARQGCYPCAPQRSQVYYSQAPRCYTRSYHYYAPVIPMSPPSYPANPVHPSAPAVQPASPPQYRQPVPLKIQPSEANCPNGSCTQESIQSTELAFKPSI